MLDSSMDRLDFLLSASSMSVDGLLLSPPLDHSHSGVQQEIRIPKKRIYR